MSRAANPAGMLGVDGPVDNDRITIKDTHAYHRIATYPKQERGFPMQQQMVNQLNPLLGMVGSRRRESGHHRAVEQHQWQVD